MAYNKADLERQALEAIKENNLMFVTDVPTYLPCSVATFYNKKLEELESIKDALERNRVKVKNGLRAKWYKSDNPTAQIALYKLIGLRLALSAEEALERFQDKITAIHWLLRLALSAEEALELKLCLRA